MMKYLKLIVFLLFLSFGCQKEDDIISIDTFGERFVPTDVLVKTKGYFTIDKVFKWINKLHLDVESIKYGFYTSSLPPDSLQYILDYLNAKPYTHDGVWNVTGYIHYKTNKITIFPKLFHMNNKKYQKDWLKSMRKLKLVEDTTSEVSGNNILFHVPKGEEKKWVKKFRKYDFVEWAQLNYIVQLNGWP